MPAVIESPTAAGEVSFTFPVWRFRLKSDALPVDVVDTPENQSSTYVPPITVSADPAPDLFDAICILPLEVADAVIPANFRFIAAAH